MTNETQNTDLNNPRIRRMLYEQANDILREAGLSPNGRSRDRENYHQNKFEYSMQLGAYSNLRRS